MMQAGSFEKELGESSNPTNLCKKCYCVRLTCQGFANTAAGKKSCGDAAKAARVASGTDNYAAIKADSQAQGSNNPTCQLQSELGESNKNGVQSDTFTLSHADSTGQGNYDYVTATAAVVGRT